MVKILNCEYGVRFNFKLGVGVIFGNGVVEVIFDWGVDVIFE